MPRPTERSRPSNRLLARLSARDFQLIEPYLVPVKLNLRKRLEIRNRRIDAIYFIESGIASVIASDGGKGVEVGLVGLEGVSGLAVLMQAERSPFDTFMQVAGEGLCITTANLKKSLDASPTLRRILQRFAFAFMVQVAQTAQANARGKVEERLARWLLMACDRMDQDELPLTHESLALMLGVRRPGVTVALNLLENAGLIQLNRGQIIIVDRKGLEQRSSGTYGLSETEYRRLLG